MATEHYTPSSTAAPGRGRYGYLRHVTLERTLPRIVIVVALMVAGCSQGLAFQQHSKDVGLRGKTPNVNAVTRWNRVATETFPIEPGPIIDSRAFAILHAAVHDAVNGIERRYEPYTIDLSFPGASLDAAWHRRRTTCSPSWRRVIGNESIASMRRR